MRHVKNVKTEILYIASIFYYNEKNNLVGSKFYQTLICFEMFS